MYNDHFLNELGSQVNPNQTIADPFLNNLSQTMLYNSYVPIKQIRRDPVLSSHNKISTPPGYLNCSISLYYAGVYDRTFQILFPESISESISANFTKESPVGSTYPITAFSNTGEQKVPMSFVVLSDYLPDGYSSVRAFIKDLKLMCKPKYSGSIVKSPSVQITFGDITFYGVCESISVEYANVYGNNSMVKATVSCDFTITEAL